VLLGLTSVLVLLVSVGGWAFYSYLNGNVHHISLGLGGNRPAGAHGVTDYLLVGTDSRAGSDGAYGKAPGQRSDSTILVHLAANGTTTMVSFPRDTFVTIPAYTDSSGKDHAQHKGKFNSAISDGGPSLLVSLVESLTGLRVDHYVSMDLAGFKAITNAIGGVDVCVLPSTNRERFQDDNGRWVVSTNTKDPLSGWAGGPGTIHVNGDQGLAFVRQRHGLPAGDIDRIRRQQQFIGAVYRKATAGDVLTNPVKLEGLVSAATSALTLDNDTSIADLKGLALQMKGMAGGSMQMETLPTHPPTAAEGGIGTTGTLPVYGAVQVYNPADLARIVVPLGGHVDGVEDTAAPSTATTPPVDLGPVTVAPSQVTVSVYNGSQRSGLAASAASKLTDAGFHVASAGNASSHGYTSSRVLYGAGQQAAARTVQAAVPGSSVSADPSVSGVRLILGSNFTTVVTPALGAQPSTAPPAAATTPPPAAAAPNCTY
jgi:LCP family protein required for cell wall assembly